MQCVHAISSPQRPTTITHAGWDRRSHPVAVSSAASWSVLRAGSGQRALGGVHFERLERAVETSGDRTELRRADGVTAGTQRHRPHRQVIQAVREVPSHHGQARSRGHEVNGAGLVGRITVQRRTSEATREVGAAGGVTHDEHAAAHLEGTAPERRRASRRPPVRGPSGPAPGW
jgi:hypothetical protein